MDEYKYGEFYIRPQMMAAIKRYIKDCIQPGGFLTAVIENDLAGACGKADQENLHNLPAFVAYFYNEAPSTCWGSPEKMNTWMANK